MATDVFIARQPIKNLHGKLIGYELLYRDNPRGIDDFPSNIAATSKVLFNLLTHLNIDNVLEDRLGFLNVDEEMLQHDILDMLDYDKYVIELLETIDVTPEVVSKVRLLKQAGFIIAVDDFDASSEMLKQFNPLWKYVNILKIDIQTVNEENLVKLIPKFKKMGITLLAEKIETVEDYKKYIDFGFEYFQGYYIGKPEIKTCKSIKDATRVIILQLMVLLKQDASTTQIEEYIKTRPELVYNILKFVNNQQEFTKKISTISQAITMIGRNPLSQWLLIFLFAEVEGEALSNNVLEATIDRAEEMARHYPESPEKGYMVGMFSMLDSLFDIEINEIFDTIAVDSEIRSAVIRKSGPLGEALKQTEAEEKIKIKEAYIKNFEKISSADMRKILNSNGVHI